MLTKLQKFISTSLILALVFTRVFLFVPSVVAEEPTAPTMPSAPSAPTAPSLNYTPPAPPNSLQSPPSAPSTPSFSSVPPTSAPMPTYEVPAANPTEPPQSASEALPTGDTLSTGTSDPSATPGVDDGSQAGTSSETQNNSSSDQAQSSSTSSGSSSGSSGSVNDPANTNTGPGSTNTAQEKYDAAMEQLNKNLAEVQNKINAITNTGFNYANLNTLDGHVFSGDALAQLNLLNKLNSNMTGLGGFSVFNVYDTYIGDIVFKMADGSVAGSFSTASGNVSKNAVTGPGSTNNAEAESSFKVKEANGNDAQIDNNINLQATSGNNTASGNTGNGTIETGNATAIGNIVNMVNTNLNVTKWLIGVVNIWGTLLGNIILPQEGDGGSNNTATPVVFSGNTNTGSGSTNNATYSSNNTASFENVNETAIKSFVDTSANTGNNTASVNTGGGSVTTGNSDVSVSDTTVANVNTNNQEETVWMVIVNQAGRWIGYILGAPWGATSASNTLPITQTNSGAGTQTFITENSNTGPGSDNNSSYSQTANTTVENSNVASITNNITADSSTGNNEASFNTGAGVIETGDAEVGLNLVNMANTNVTAKKFIAILVNVIGGGFLGNIIPPNNEVVLPTLSPVPTIPPLSEITDEPGNIGGLEDTTQTDNTDYSSDYYSDDSYTYQQQYEASNYPPAYNEAVNQVMYARRKVALLQKQYSSGAPTQQYVNQQVIRFKRGVFLSPAFAKAVESSFPGILLGGMKFKVNQSWLSIIPFAIFVLYLRRRRKFNITRYINSLLEIIL